MVEIFALNITTFPFSSIEPKTFCLPTDKIEQLKRFKHEDDYKRTLAGQILISEIILKKFEKDFINIKYSDISIKSDTNGKPYLELIQNKLITGYHFNISHSGEWVVCATGCKPVGIDIEEIKPFDLSLCPEFLSPDELRCLESKPEIEKLAFFYELWTLKESLVKAVGKGLSIPLNSFSILNQTDKIEIFTDLYSGYVLKQFHFNNQYKLAVCSSGEEISEVIKFMKL